MSIHTGSVSMQGSVSLSSVPAGTYSQGVNSEATLNKPFLLSVAKSSHQAVLADIYQDNINMAVWERPLGLLSAYAHSLLTSSPNFAFKSQGDSAQIEVLLHRVLPDLPGKEAFLKDIVLLIDMFACLFGLDNVGLRLTALSNAMCPRFHVDKILCRLVSTYAGVGSEWLHEAHVVRAHLGHGSHVADHNSGLHEKGRVNQLKAGDVALMKGNEWPTSLGFGVVHRSPMISAEEPRLFLSLDMI